MFFKIPPTDFKYQVTTVTCIVEYDGEILLIKRVPGSVQGAKWGVPGGKAEKSEDLPKALVREIKEETGIDIEPQKLTKIGVAYVRYPEFDFTNHQYHATLKGRLEVKLKPDEHCDHIWVTPHEAMKMDLILDQEQCFGEYYGFKP